MTNSPALFADAAGDSIGKTAPPIAKTSKIVRTRRREGFESHLSPPRQMSGRNCLPLADAPYIRPRRALHQQMHKSSAGQNYQECESKNESLGN